MKKKRYNSCVGCENEPIWEKVPYTIFFMNEQVHKDGYSIEGYCSYIEDDVSMNSSENGPCSGFQPKEQTNARD